MHLLDLLAGVVSVQAPASNPQVTGLSYDSRLVKPGDVFVAIPGTHTDGHNFVPDAFRTGAVAAIVERRVGSAEPQVVVDNTRRALALAAANFFHHPSRDMLLVGVTGTDGKTTTSILIHEILVHAGYRAGAMNTVDLRFGSLVDPNETRQTTLEALEIQEQLAHMRDSGLRYAVIETSSHGLALDRVLGCHYDVAIFTNIAHEHIDFHHSFDAYVQAKARLIEMTAASADKGVLKTAVLNRDDPSFSQLVKLPIARRLTYGLQLPSDLQATRVEASAHGLHVDATTPLGLLSVDLKLAGRWNASNALAAAGGCIALGLSLEQIARGLESVEGVSGRMERVDLGQPYAVIIDYAHTPQSLEKVLRELRPLARGRLIAVFGSAGERDRQKRPWMGEIAARLADYAVFTNEDPRDEDPQQILREIASGAQEVGWQESVNYVCIADRRQAIAHAIARARAGDTVLLAGKGHERSILAGPAPQPWDEREAAIAAIQAGRPS